MLFKDTTESSEGENNYYNRMMNYVDFFFYIEIHIHKINHILNIIQALQTLRKYPVVLTSGKECKILQNFGEFYSCLA